MNRWIAPALGAWLALCGAGAAAHDTWLTALRPTPNGELGLALGTGTQYPGYEFPIGMEQIARSGCRGDAVNEAPLQWVGDRSNALLLRSSQVVPEGAALTCWVQLVPFDLTIDPPVVQIYLDEIKAPPAIRQLWAERLARGVRWTERYVKYARIEWGHAASAATTAPIDMGMDVQLIAPRRPLRRGDEASFVVLRDGLPLPELAVELRSDLSPIGLWRKTDAQGRVTIKLPLAGRWLLRGTDLRPSSSRSDEWDSRFVTLAFDVAP